MVLTLLALDGIVVSSSPRRGSRTEDPRYTPGLAACGAGVVHVPASRPARAQLISSCNIHISISGQIRIQERIRLGQVGIGTSVKPASTESTTFWRSMHMATAWRTRTSLKKPGCLLHPVFPLTCVALWMPQGKFLHDRHGGKQSLQLIFWPSNNTQLSTWPSSGSRIKNVRQLPASTQVADV